MREQLDDLESYEIQTSNLPDRINAAASVNQPPTTDAYGNEDNVPEYVSSDSDGCYEVVETVRRFILLYLRLIEGG
jgi:hypothetical protein